MYQRTDLVIYPAHHFSACVGTPRVGRLSNDCGLATPCHHSIARDGRSVYKRCIHPFSSTTQQRGCSFLSVEPLTGRHDICRRTSAMSAHQETSPTPTKGLMVCSAMRPS